MLLGRNRPVGYQLQRSNRYVFRIALGTVATTLAIFAVLPFTQALSSDPRDRVIRSIDVAKLPPPEPPPPEPPPPEQEEEIEPPPSDEPPPMLDISMLESMLNPGTGGAALASLDLSGFSTAGSSIEEALVFSLRDLDRTPRLRSGGNLQFPPEVQRSGIVGRVRARIQISPKGTTQVMEIADSPHPMITEVLRREIVKWIYDPPTVNGEPVTAEYWQPFDIDFTK